MTPDTPADLAAAIERLTIYSDDVDKYADSALTIQHVADIRTLLVAVKALPQWKDTGELVAENAALREELAEQLETTLRQGSVEAGPHNGYGRKQWGWLDSCSSSDVCAAGDRLVQLGVYEKHPDGAGRRQFYRKQT